MENLAVNELRSRSRSKTPFLRSTCDGENCTEGDDHTHHKAGRKTPVKSRHTPVKQLGPPTVTETVETIREVTEEYSSPPAHRTRQSTKNTTDRLVKTSDYSSEESLDRLKGHRKEIFQNEINSQYERVSTSSQRYSTFADVTLSPVHAAYSASLDRSSRIGSPTYSVCSTDSSFAEQALADTSTLLDRDPNGEHLPSRLYKMAGEYWNKYPKTDYTYSPLSKDRVELAPGQVAMPNMSRRSLSQFRIQGPNTSPDELDRLSATSAWTATTVRKRYTAIDSSDDETGYIQNKGAVVAHDERWWITSLFVSIISGIASGTRGAYRRLVGPAHRYPYTDRRPTPQAGLVSRAGSAALAPFYWIYTTVKNVVTTTVTTITETVSPNHANESEKYVARRYKEKTAKEAAVGRRWWPWLLLLLLPVVAYGCYNYSDFVIQEKEILDDAYSSPRISQDSDLADRMRALEAWALSVDSRLKLFDQKLSKLDNIESQIEQYSLMHLQQNLMQILTRDNTDALALKLKAYFDQNYVTPDQLREASLVLNERLANIGQAELDEDRIKEMVQEYLALFERRQLEVIVKKVEEHVKDVEVQRTGSGVDMEAVRTLVAGMLEVYDADKTGLVDYALESAGGQVLSTRCTELYQIKSKQYWVLGVPVLWVHTSPRNALTAGAAPADCWAFQGFPGYLVIKTYAIIEVTGFSLEHMSKLLAIDGKIESAPKNFSVYGLHGELDPEPHLFGDYMYDADGKSIQYFPVKHPKTTNIDGIEYPVAYDIVELRIESNHGNPTYTCVYRFRVHGNPLADVRRAAEDSMHDSQL